MKDQTLIADMVRAGVDAEFIGRVANALLNVRDNVRDIAVKEHERSRKRKWREAIAAVANSGGAQANDGARAKANNVPQNVPDISVIRCDLLPSSASLEVVTEEGSKKKKKEAVTKCARGTRMEPDAPLSDAFQNAATALGADPLRIPAMWAEFVDYWIGIPGNRGVKLDWLATWRNRVRDIAARGQNGQRSSFNRTYSPSGAQQSSSDAVLAGVAAAAGRRARERGQGQLQPDTAASSEPDAELFGAGDG